MNTKKVHLVGLSYTLCGIDMHSISLLTRPELAKKFSQVTCKRCKKSKEYRMYLAGKFREKPAKFAKNFRMR